MGALPAKRTCGLVGRPGYLAAVHSRWLRLTHDTKLLSLRACAALFALSLLVGTLSFMYIEGWVWGEAFYMAVITIATVGFTEVHPLSGAGRAFTSGYVIVNLAITALFITQLTQRLSDGGLLAQLRFRIMVKEIERVRDHIIVCGIGRYGREIVNQLVAAGEDVVVVERDGEHIRAFVHEHPELLYVEGDATAEDDLQRAGLGRAKAVIVTLGNDSDNAFAVLTARQLSPEIAIIARTYQPESRQKMLRVGADHAVQPEQIGGFFMSALVRKPSAVEFFTSLATGPAADIGFEEVSQERLPARLRACSLQEMDLRRLTGVSVIALRYADGHYEVNPDATRTLDGGTSMIALGDRDQLARLRDLLEKSPDS